MQLFTEKILTNPDYLEELIAFINDKLKVSVTDVSQFEERLAEYNVKNQTQLWSSYTELNQTELESLQLRIDSYNQTNSTRAAEVCNTTWLVASA